jgi:hypothetical protein
MNYSRIICSVLLCSGITLLQAAQTTKHPTLSNDPKKSFANVNTKIANLRNLIDGGHVKNKNALQSQMGAIRGSDASWKLLNQALQDPASRNLIIEGIDIKTIQSNIEAIEQHAANLKASEVKKFRIVKEMINNLADPIKADAKNQQASQQNLTNPSDADSKNHNTNTPSSDESSNNDSKTQISTSDKDLKKQQEQTTDPKTTQKLQDPLNNAGFFRTYLFNAKTVITACILAATYWAYTNYAQSEESAQEASEVTEQAKQ